MKSPAPSVLPQLDAALAAQGLTTLIWKNHPTDDLIALLAPIGVTPTQVRQLQARAVAFGADEVTVLPTLSRPRLEALRARSSFPHLKLLQQERSKVDGFTRFLFETLDGKLVESVRIPLLAHRYSICVSSQVGCALGCAFCATGRLGFQRNLEPWEIVDQVFQAGMGADRPVTGVLFMGQGEPFMNYDNVIKAANILRDPCGGRISAKNITISTAGIVPMIRRFTEEKHPYRLIVSLVAATSEKRRELMPIERKYPLPALVEAIAGYAQATGTRATVAWLAMEGVNTSEADIEALGKLLEGIPIRLNLIEINDKTGRFSRPEGDAFRALVDRLQRLKVPIVRRYAGGSDVDAACGMLAAKRVAEQADGDAPSCPAVTTEAASSLSTGDDDGLSRRLVHGAATCLGTSSPIPFSTRGEGEKSKISSPSPFDGEGVGGED